MVSLERKFDVLHHSIASFTRWLDGCTPLLERLSASQASLESVREGREGGGEGERREEGRENEEEEAQLRDLALQYKDMLLQIKEQCTYMQKINILCKEIRSETKDERQIQRHAKAYEKVHILSRRFTVTCATTKQQYSHLSSLLQSSSEAKISPGVLRISTPSFSPIPTLAHRITKTPPPSTHPPRPSSAQAHRPILPGSYQPVFIQPTAFSLADREKEEGGSGDPRGGHMSREGLKFENERAKSHDDGPSEAKVNVKSGPRTPTKDKPKSTKSVENRANQTTSQTKSGTKLLKTQQSGAMTDQTDQIPEIISLEGSPVVPGRRMFRTISQERLDGNEDRGSPDMGQPHDERGSPILPVFGNGVPDLWMDGPRSSAHTAQKGDRVKVLPALETESGGRPYPLPPLVKPKPTVPKKPPYLKQKSEQQQQNHIQPMSSAEGEEGKNRPKKSSRFSKLPGFGGTTDGPRLFGKLRKDGEKKEKGTVGGSGGRGGGGGGGEGRDMREAASGKKVKSGKKPMKEDGRNSPKLFAGDHEEMQWEGPDDGRESPILQGKRGVKVMLTDDSERIAAPPRVAESAKPKAQPPPVAKKPMGLMERITSEKKTSNGSAKTRRTHKPWSTARHHKAPADAPTPEARDRSNPSQEIDAAPSQNRPPQLRVRLYKLENLAAGSVQSRLDSGASSGEQALPNGVNLSKIPTQTRETGGVRDTHFSSNSRDSSENRLSRVATHDSEDTSRFEKLDLHAGTVRGRADKAVSTNSLKAARPTSKVSASSINMDSSPVYDRLGLGLIAGVGGATANVSGATVNVSGATANVSGATATEDDDSDRYDRLDDVERIIAELERESAESSRREKEAESRDVVSKDEGRSYFIGGRGRRERELESSGSFASQSKRDAIRADRGPTSPEQEQMSLKSRLKGLSDDLQGHIQVIADREKSSLQSLGLEIHMGEVKAMLTLLEVQDFELAILRATFSNASKKKLALLANPPAPRWPNFPPEEIQKNREEILKLSDRISLLEKHCEDSITQIEEVMEFVLLFEDDLKVLNKFLTISKERLQLSREMGGQHLEEAWEMLTETLADVNGQRTKLSSVEQLSNHLLYLEPIFDGDSVREDMQHLGTEYQGIILEIFSQLEALSHTKCQQLLLDMSVVSSWTTEAGLAVQALAKRSRQSTGEGDRIAATKETLDGELKLHKSTLLTVTKELKKITSLLSPDDHDSLKELVYHVRQASNSLGQIEKALRSMEFGNRAVKVKGNGAKSVDADYMEMSDLEDSLKLLSRKDSRVLPPVPVRNGNGAKAKESDYARIEDLKVHRHSQSVHKKPKRLVPYAECSMKDPVKEGSSAVRRYTEVDVVPCPPPRVPSRSDRSSSKKEKSPNPEVYDLKPGQSIRDLPLPPRPDEKREETLDFGRSPSPLPPPSDLLSGQAGSDLELSLHSIYDVPRSLRRGEVQDLYDIPKSLTHQPSDLYDVPRSLTRQGDSVSPPLYDVPRSLAEGHSGQGESGQAGSGQDGEGEMGGREVSPHQIYDIPRTLLEPPSPLVESNQFTTQLDKAIHRLPHSAPYRPELEELGVELRVNGAGIRPSSLHEDLLQFIIDEWAQIPTESSPLSSGSSRVAIEETARLLEDHTHMEACLNFAHQVGQLEENVKAVVERISNLRVPAEPDLEKVHNGIDQCESLFTHLKKLQPFLTSCNEKSLVLLSSLSTPPPPPHLPSSHPPPTPHPSVKLAQLIEIWLFDLTTSLQTAHMQLATKLRELREHESLTNGLHRQLQTLSHTLSATTRLINERDDVIEVRGYLQQCKEMQNQLSSQSDQIDQLVAKIRDHVTANPQSHACQELLEQAQQIEKDWTNTCKELSAVPQMEPTLRVNMLRNVATAIEAMDKDLPGLEVTGLKLDDIVEKQRKARSLVSKTRQLLSALQTAEVNLQQTLSPPAGSHGNQAVQEVVGGVNHTHQQKQCRDLQQECRKMLSELTMLSSLLATSHTLLDRLTNETQDLRVWVDDIRGVLEQGQKTEESQHRVKIQAISQQLMARQRSMDSYQSLVSEVLLLPGGEREKKEIEKEAMALYNDWDSICQQCVPAGTLPLMSPTTPQSQCFQAPQEFDDPLQMVEWLILLESKLQPEKLIVGDFLHVRKALRDVQLIEEELRSKEKVYEQFMKGYDTELKTRPDMENGNQQMDSLSPEPLSAPEADSLEFNSLKGVKAIDDKTAERRKWLYGPGMESVQEQNGEEEDGMETPRVVESDSNIRNDLHGDKATSSFNWSERRQNSVPPMSTQRQYTNQTSLPKQTTFPLLTPHSSLHHSSTQSSLSTPHSSLHHSSTQPSLHHTPTQTSLLSSLSSVDCGPRSLLNRQFSLCSSVTTSLAELLEEGSQTAGMPEDLGQLMLLWNAIKTAIGQKRQRLEQIRDLWNTFERMKEEFVNFLSMAEGRLARFQETLGQAMDMGVIQNEIETQKAFLQDIPTYEQKHAVLNELGHNLATRYHADDSTTDLQDVLKDINQRWTAVMESVSRHQPEVNLLSQQWAEFHTHYQSFHQWLLNMDTEMANLNPFISNMATVQMQLIKLKEIQEELTAHEGAIQSIKLLSYKLQHEEGGSCHVNPAAIHSRLESASRRWDHLLKLAQERHLALEESLTDKQQLLTRMADCLSWLQQAEQHMASQQPLGGDYYQIHNQYIAHETFGQEVQEQVPKMEAVVQAGRSGLLEVQWPSGTPERSRMDSLRSEFTAVERRWVKLRGEAEKWGKMLERIHPEMETFQTLCAECGQRLSEVELRASGMPPIANRVVMLTQQLEELREFEAGLVVVGNVLENVISSQKKLVQLGANISSDLAELVKRFHERWVEVKQKVTNRYSTIDKAMVKYDPENLGVATLPRGWIREKTNNGTPYYVQNTIAATRQWQHPELSQLYKDLEAHYNQPCYPSLAYPAALKLRALQKKTQLHLLETRIAMQTFEEDHHYNIYNSNKTINSSDMIMMCLGLFEQAEHQPAVRTETLYVHRAVELTAAWIRDIYDITHESSVTCVSFQIAILCLSHGRLEDKQRSLFRLIAGGNEVITLHQLADFLEHFVQIPQNMMQSQYCSLDALDFHTQDCFKKFADESGQLSLPQFLSWVHSEPLPLAWLAVMHRILASETTQHDVRCAVCRSGPPMTGFRYRCQQCHNYDMCQNCFWSGGTTHGHDRTRHYMEEYCVVRPSGDDLKDFFRNLQRHMKRKKKTTSSSSVEVLQEHAPHVIGDHAAMDKHPQGKTEENKRSPARQRHTAFTPISVGDDESQPHRRFTSPPSEARARDSTSPSPPRASRQHSQHHKTTSRAHDIDSSLSRISEENKSLSHSLNSLRRHRESLSSDSAPPTAPRAQNGENPVVSATTSSSALQGRVKVLEDHNSKLENVISELKRVTEPQQSLKSQPPMKLERPNEGNYNQLPAANGSVGGSAHLLPPGNPFANRKRKYHYITIATGNPSHYKPSSTQSHVPAPNSHQVATATVSPTPPQYPPVPSPAHQHMVLQPPALVRNKYLGTATLL